MNKQQFIKTTDSQTKDLLLKEGFQLVNESNGIATFINDKTKVITFENKKITFSDKLEF